MWFPINRNSRAPYEFSPPPQEDTPLLRVAHQNPKKIRKVLRGRVPLIEISWTFELMTRSSFPQTDFLFGEALPSPGQRLFAILILECLPFRLISPPHLKSPRRLPSLSGPLFLSDRVSRRELFSGYQQYLSLSSAFFLDSDLLSFPLSPAPLGLFHPTLTPLLAVVGRRF